MSNKKTGALYPIPKTVEEAKKVMADFAKYGSSRGVSKVVGVHHSQTARVKLAAEALLGKAEMTGGHAELPDFGPDDVPIEEVITRLKKSNRVRIDHANSKKWFSIKLKDNKAIGVVFFGDPHLDDNACNWERLDEDIKLVAGHKRLFGINIGDSHNNWAGKLMKLYAEQETSQRTAYRLVRWFLFDSGIKWLVWLIGNHDAWGEGMDRMKEMGAKSVVMEDWRAQFKLVFPNGTEVLIDAAHDHKGSSIWNELHGQQRVVVTERTPHIAISGDRHYPALQEKWNPHEDRVQKSWLCRVASFKWVDAHAKHNGFYDYQAAPSMMAVIDPDNPNDPVMMFSDLARGVRELDYLLSRGTKNAKNKPVTK